ncbi:lysozyme protein [Rhizobium phage RHph_TM16]|nr:lysozyme protein [Rhizobium phage RHph_TM16]
MPVNKIVATKRGKSAAAGALLLAAASGWAAFTGEKPTPAHPEATPVKIHAAIAQGLTPPAVQLAIKELIKPWEGVKLVAYLDVVGVPTVCWGETMVNGKPVKLGMTFTMAECDAMLIHRVIFDYYLPLVDKVDGFAQAPYSVQASMTSGAYNFGVGAAIKSTAAKRVGQNRYRDACEAQTAFNKAGKMVVRGLVLRREMGDSQRMGEAELCVSGLAPETAMLMLEDGWVIYDPDMET